jgi:branched-chain amino acid transport system ATP-binding protein
VTAVLEVAGVSKRFGGVRALEDVSFSVGDSELFTIIGPNGAGKTTLLNIVTGLVSADEGTVILNGRKTTRSSWRNAGRGLARTLQTPVVFPDMTALENVMLGHVARKRIAFVPALLGLPHVREWERDAREKAEELLELLGISDKADRLATELPLGMQRLVEIGRALATEPKIMLLDEPAAGLAHREVDRLGALLKATTKRGVAVCLVEHNMRLVMGVAERILVIQQGAPLFEGTPSEVQQHPEVIAAYLGKRGAARAASEIHAAG